MNQMRRLGVDLTIIDGALSRLSSASPAVSESMILATGAAYSANINTLVQKTAHVVQLINLPLADEGLRNTFGALDKGTWWLDDEGTLNELSSVTSLSQNIRFQGMERCRTLFVAGALVDSFIEKVRKNKDLKHVEIVVRDFTRIFVSPQLFRLFVKGGGRVTVLHKSQLIAVTVNPTSPSGYVLDSDILCEKLSEAIELPVYDLLKNK
jgi:hypothetical protein